MAIFTGEPPFVGTRGGITIYRCAGQWRVRRCNHLCTKRVNTSVEFAALRRYAHWLAIAAPLAAQVHRTLPQGRQRKHYQRLAGKAIQYLKDGKSSEEVVVLLREEAAVINHELQQEKLVVSTDSMQQAKLTCNNRKQRPGKVCTLPVLSRLQPFVQLPLRQERLPGFSEYMYSLNCRGPGQELRARA